MKRETAIRMKKLRLYVAIFLLLVSILIGGGIYWFKGNREGEYGEILKIQKINQAENRQDLDRPILALISRLTAKETR